MAGTSKRTTNHDEIRRWIEERGGKPAIVKSTEEGDGEGLLRVDFPGYRGKNRLEEISWEGFFKTFDTRELEFLYQEKTAGGNTSRFSKFVARKEGDSGGKGTGSRKSGGKAKAEKSTGGKSADAEKSGSRRTKKSDSK